MRTLVIGYGNPDREDDGVAWHILSALAQRLGRTVPAEPEDGFRPCGAEPDLLFDLQLKPEMAETAAQYEQVCFVDAHTGSFPDDIVWAAVAPARQTSPFTHHLTPAAFLALAEITYGIRPAAWLLSVRGRRFGFGRTLAPETAAFAEQAAEQLHAWLDD